MEIHLGTRYDNWPTYTIVIARNIFSSTLPANCYMLVQIARLQT